MSESRPDTLPPDAGTASGPPSESGAAASLGLWLQLMKCAKAFEAAVGTRFRREFDQSLARFDVLSQLYRMPGHCGTVGQIAANVMAASGNITALIDRMADEGLVARRPSPSDRRSSEVLMTDAGLDLFGRMTDAHGHWIETLLAGFPEAESARLADLLRDVRRRVERRDTPPDHPE